MVIFDNLSGNWSLHRIINHSMSVHGVAKFIPMSANQLLYKEDGELLLHGKHRPIKIYNEFIYMLNDGVMRIFSSSCEKVKELLHTFTLNIDSTHEASDVSVSGEHVCALDHYHGKYEFDKKIIRIRYEIYGPNKDLIIETILEKLI